MSEAVLDPDQYTKAGSITKSYYRNVYPAIDPTKPELSLSGKVTIVTGAGKGIGRDIALAHAKAGVKGLVLITQSALSGKDTEAAVKAEFPSVEVLALTTDITDESSVAKAFETIKKTYGVAHTLINNAGVFANVEPIVKADPAVWWKDFEVNVRGTYLVTAAYLQLISGDSSVQPTIINFVSTIGLTPPGLSSYFTSKLGVAKFTEFIDAEQASAVAYSLSPGIVLTSMTLDGFKPFAKDTPELSGAFTVYLAAKRPAYLSGRHLVVNWDVEELEARKDEISSSNKLKLGQFV